MTEYLDLAQRRLLKQRLAGPLCAEPGEVVRWLGAVQAQDYLAALWAVGLRTQGATEADVERTIEDKRIVRVWFMRGTLHFVPARDIRWMIQLMAPRMRRLLDNTSRSNRLELDEATFARTNAIIVDVLERAHRATRAELSAALEQEGISATGVRFSLILQRAQADGLICYAARRGKQHTLALVDEWLPPAPVIVGDDALAEFTRRYFVSHGPATVQDYAWWSGLSLTEARAALDMVRSELEHEVLDGRTYWFVHPASADSTCSSAHLLPNYDEYIVGYRDRSAAVDATRTVHLHPGSPTVLQHIIVLDGRILGTWKRSLRPDGVVIAADPLTALSSAEVEAYTAAARRYGEYLGLPIVLTEADGVGLEAK